MHVDHAGGEQHVRERAPASPFVNDSPLRSKEHSRMKRLNWAGDLTIRSIGQSSPARRYTRKSYTSSLCELHCTRSSRVPCPQTNWFSGTLQHDSFSMAILGTPMAAIAEPIEHNQHLLGIHIDACVARGTVSLV
ncbi:hypothetical protein AcW1_010087 [Taiwanofungus camphoratus]|nr:hypothetical protein AcW1_010087 [Antrodia cinnamomea]